MSAWTNFVMHWKDCTRCPLAAQRDNIVLARGTLPCDILFIGEAPGTAEDALGRPFVGPAGQLLDQIVTRALGGVLVCELCGLIACGHRSSDRQLALAFTNLVCCFPRKAKARGDNEPDANEILACRPRLLEFIDIASPRLIVRVGSLASDWVEHNAYGKITYGKTLQAEVIDITHPAAILRMPLAQKGFAVQRCIVQLRNAVQMAILQGEGGNAGG